MPASTQTLWLVRIDDRMYGFRVVALIARDQESCQAAVTKKYGAKWGGPVWQQPRASIVDSASATQGSFAEMKFQE